MISIACFQYSRANTQTEIKTAKMVGRQWFDAVYIYLP